MSRDRKMVTIVVHRDGELENRIYKVPVGLVRTAKVTGITVAALVLVGAVLYAPVARTAARVPGLNREIQELSSEVEQVRELEETLNHLEARYDQVRTALGANIVPELGSVSDSTPRASPILAGLPTRQREYPTGPSLPTFWPLDSLIHPGVVTRGQIAGGNGAQAHPGIDIAVGTGTPIRAAGGGEVREAGYDPEYGLFVLIDHPDGYQTMYGHASRLLVKPHDKIDAGQVIALAGNTGRSTAPHLHYERRHGNALVDPLTPLQRER
jgi:murein DD-endopeptidase MepM/ murein hydrolase activator NlpD